MSCCHQTICRAGVSYLAYLTWNQDGSLRAGQVFDHLGTFGAANTMADITGIGAYTIGACAAAAPVVTLTDCAGLPIPTTTPLLSRNSATATATALGGLTPASKILWSFPTDGLSCPTVLRAPTDACTNPAYPTSPLALGALADGTVGWVKPAAPAKRAQRTVTAAYTVDLLLDDVIFANANAASFIVTMPAFTAANLCQRDRFTIKRTDNNPLTHVRVASSAIDGAPGNTIQLGTSSAFGTQTGEAATLQWDTAAATWRVI